MSLRNIAILLTGALAIIYVFILVLLYVDQRSYLFLGGTHEFAMPASYRVVTVTERDATRLTVWEMSPADRAPIIVFFYGNAGSLSDFADLGERLHTEGYGVVLASYRGYSGNRGIPTEAGLMSDARAVLGTLPKSHAVVLWGQSLGSGVAAGMASEGRASALIMQSPYTSVVDVAALRFPIFPVRWLMKDRFDTFSLAPKIKLPVLIMHGTDDDVVPFRMGVALAHRFGRQATFVPILRRGHNDLSTDDLLVVAGKWLKEHRPA